MSYDKVCSEVTAVIKTFQRPEKLKNLMESIRCHYPELPVVIVDDSKSKLDWSWDPFTKYIYTKYDIGVSEGRNLAVENVQSPYTLLLDDDVTFTEKTHIETFMKILQTTSFDLVGGNIVNYGIKELKYHGCFAIQRGNLYLRMKEHSEYLDGHPRYHFVLNFFLAKTELLRRHPWSSSLKIAEHEEFFWRLRQNGAKITYTNAVSVNHYPIHLIETIVMKRDKAYVQGRVTRFFDYKAKACQLMGVNGFKQVYKIPGFLFIDKVCNRLVGIIYHFFVLIRRVFIH